MFGFSKKNKTGVQAPAAAQRRSYNHKESIIDRYDRFLDQTNLDLRIKESIDEAHWQFSCSFNGLIYKNPQETGVIMTASWFDSMGLLGNRESWQSEADDDDDEFEEEYNSGGTGLMELETDKIEAYEVIPWKEGPFNGWYHLRIDQDPVVILDDTRRIVLLRNWTNPDWHNSHRVVQAHVLLEMAEAQKIEVSWGERYCQLDYEQVEAIRDYVNRLTDPSKRARGPYPNQAGEWIHWRTADGQLDAESVLDESQTKETTDSDSGDIF